jgi:Carboxypeptidase regulatory-like domain
MRFSSVRLLVLALFLWATLSLSVWATGFGYRETVYLAPTMATFSTPAAYVVPSAYYLPTAYVAPTYYATSYVSAPVVFEPAAYVDTVYRTGLFRRRLVVERSLVAPYASVYLPTVYYAPTIATASVRATTYVPTRYVATAYEYPRVWETAYASPAVGDCDEVLWSRPAAQSSPASAASPRSNANSRTVQSEPADDPTIPSDVGPAPGAATTAPNRPTTDTTPAVPAAQRSTAQPAKNTPGTAAQSGNAATDSRKAGAATDADKPKPPTPKAPSGDDDGLVPAPGSAEQPAGEHQSMRPVYTTRSRADLRNVLIGRVETDSGDPRGEVSVSVTNNSNSLLRRDGMTNAFGNFAIRLTDGDWTVNVRMPSGSLKAVRTVTVSNGKVVDKQEGREVRNLIIYY